EPFVAFRLLGMRDVVSEREEWPFAGRERERSHILDAWRVALQNRRCVMITVVGEAGIGKSRLVEAAVSAIDARVVSGRCLPYGEGITYWPVVEIMRQLGVMPSQPAAAQALGDLLGQTASGTSGEEIGWAFRKLLERSGPL